MGEGVEGTGVYISLVSTKDLGNHHSISFLRQPNTLPTPHVPAPGRTCSVRARASTPPLKPDLINFSTVPIYFFLLGHDPNLHPGPLPHPHSRRLTKQFWPLSRAAEARTPADRTPPDRTPADPTPPGATPCVRLRHAPAHFPGLRSRTHPCSWSQSPC